MASYTDSKNLLAGLNNCARPLAIKVLNAAPTTYNGHTVSIGIVSGTRNTEDNIKAGGVKQSCHLWGAAIDVHIFLDGVLFAYPGGYPGYNRNVADLTISGITANPYNLYSTILSSAASSNGGAWGGNFVNSPFDPVHIQFVQCKIGNGGTIGTNEDGVQFVAVQPFGFDAFTIDAGTDSLQNNQVITGSASLNNSLINSSNALLYIGYGLVLSNIQSNDNGKNYVDNLLTYAALDDVTKTNIDNLIGLTGNDAYNNYLQNKNISITSDQADSIFLDQLNILITELTAKGFDFTKYPGPISTAIASYFFGKNTTSTQSTNDITELLTLLGNQEYSNVSLFFETQAAKLPIDLQQKRLAEAALAKTYANTPVVSQFLLTTTTNPIVYENNITALNTQLNTQLTQLNQMFGGSTSSPASPDYDNTFNDVSVNTITAVASMMQAQQINYDVYFGTRDDDYTRRIKIKDLYSILSRNLNLNISGVDAILQNNPILENKNDYSLTEIYDMIPYSNNIGYIVKNNAVNRCNIRIRILEQKIKNKQSDLLNAGLPDISSWASILLFLVKVELFMGVVDLEILTSLVTGLFGELAVLKQQLSMEKYTINYYIKDMNRYRYEN